MAEGKLGERLGAEVSWRLFGTGPSIVNAFEKGELDLAYIGLPPAIIGISRGVPAICIAGGHIEGTVICAKSCLKGFPEERELAAILNQLRGCKIGVPGKGSIHDVILKDSLEQAGIAAEVEVVNFAWADQVLEAVVHDAVAAAFGTPALAAAVKYYAGGKVLFPPSQLRPHNPSCGILAERRFLGEQRETVMEFLRAHEEATAFLRERTREAAKIISGYIGFIDEDLVRDALDISPKYCAQLTDEYIAATMDLMRTQRKLGYIDRDLAKNEIFDQSLILALHGPGEHYSNKREM